MSDVLDIFFERVVNIFSFLPDKGFVTSHKLIEKTPLYGTIAFVGHEIGFVFLFDLRENYCECYVGRIVNGQFVKTQGKGGYWSTLHAFLVRKHGFRGRIPVPTNSPEDDFSILYGYKELLMNEAPELLQDRGIVFD
jgi:hypothetical protein